MWPQLPAQGEGLPTVIGFSDDFEADFTGEHGAETFSDQGVIVCYEYACRRGFIHGFHFSLSPKTHQRPIRTFESDQVPASDRLRGRAF